jgi:hypothetical protein
VIRFMDTSAVSLFPEPVTLIWTFLNLLLAIGIPAGIIIYINRMNRRIRQLEERVHRLER